MINRIQNFNVSALLENSKLKSANWGKSEILSSRKQFETNTSYRVMTSTGEDVWNWILEEDICIEQNRDGKIKNL